MRLHPDLPLLEEYLIAESDNEVRDQFANAFFLHQDPKFYHRVSELISKGTTIESAYRKSILASLSEEEKEEFASVAFGMGLDQFQKLDEKELTGNPYFALLQGLKDTKRHDISFFTRFYEANEVFLSSEQGESDDPFGRELLPLGYYPSRVGFPAIAKRGEVWMSLIPHEIETMKEAIKLAKGKVCTLGLGLGYYAYMVSENDEVKEVTIIERDRDVISLFKEHLLPRFPHKEKIHIVQGDALAHIAKEGNRYDFVFADLWHNEEDGLPLYLRLRQLEKTKTEYWIEQSILLYLRRYVITFLEEQREGYDQRQYKERGDFPSALFGALYDATKEMSIQTDDELSAFLSLSSIRDLAGKLDVKITAKAN